MDADALPPEHLSRTHFKHRFFCICKKRLKSEVCCCQKTFITEKDSVDADALPSEHMPRTSEGRKLLYVLQVCDKKPFPFLFHSFFACKRSASCCMSCRCATEILPPVFRFVSRDFRTSEGRKLLYVLQVCD